MPQNCCVPRCSSVKGGHKFPSALKSPERHRRWLVAISRMEPDKKILWSPSKFSRVCSDHFLPEDYTQTLLGERKILRREAVPSVFPFKSPEPPCASERRDRYRKRSSTVTSQPQTKKSRQDEDSKSATSDIGVAEIEVVSSSSRTLDDTDCTDCLQSNISERYVCSVCNSKENPREFKDSAVVCNLIPQTPKLNFSIDAFKKKPEVIKYYTGFDNYEHFMLLFNILGECVNHLSVPDCHLHPKDQLFVTLIKLRQAKDDIELAILFDLRRTSVSELTLIWIKFLYYQLSEIDFNPSKKIVQETMPTNFHHQFPKTRMIIDGTEVPIQKPSKVDLQSTTFSTYKNKNTLKVLVGCTPRGLVSYVSDAFGGSTSDRQICERSELLSDPSMFDKGDSIMADRGFTVQDLFATRDVSINMPSFLKGKSQLSSSEVIKDRRIASKRIHVERVIGLAKTFKILKKEFPIQRVKLGSHTISVCFFLSNFKKAIVGGHM